MRLSRMHPVKLRGLTDQLHIKPLIHHVRKQFYQLVRYCQLQGLQVTVQNWGKGVWRRRLRHSSKGFRPRARQVPNRLANAMRVLLLSALRVPPLTFHATTSSRGLCSARLLSALSPSTTNQDRIDGTSPGLL